jgi:hypothetical protein
MSEHFARPIALMRIVPLQALGVVGGSLSPRVGNFGRACAIVLPRMHADVAEMAAGFRIGR